MIQYVNLVKTILENGVEKEPARSNMPSTIGVSNAIIKMNLCEGFPLLTTKRIYFKGVLAELLWILRGDTNIKYLVDNNVNIWNQDSYRWYLKICKNNKIDVVFDTIDKFVDFVKNKEKYQNDSKYSNHLEKLKILKYEIGDLGKVYGYQWRNQNGVDQVRDVIEGLLNNPYSRYHIIDAWNKSDFEEMALPPCHLLYQFIVRPISHKERIKILYDKELYVKRDFEYTEDELNKYDIPKFYLDLNMYQRSTDVACGLPFNLASMSLLLMIMSKTCNMIPGIATWIGGDVHIYIPHIEKLKEQINRPPLKLSKVYINKKINNMNDIEKLNIDDFILHEYISHPSIKYELFTGLSNA